MAAKQAVVEYAMDDLESPILSIEDAIEHNSFFEIPAYIYPKQVGDFSKGMAEADHIIQSAEVHPLAINGRRKRKKEKNLLNPLVYNTGSPTEYCTSSYLTNIYHLFLGKAWFTVLLLHGDSDSTSYP